VSIPDMISAVAKNWPRVVSLLDDRERARLHAAVVALGDAEDATRRADLAGAIAALLIRALPADDPIVAIGPRTAPPSEDISLAAAARALRLLTVHDEPWMAERRILSTEWHRTSTLRGLGIDPDVPELIRLERPDGSQAVPMFQFDPHGRPVDIVLRVNQVLGAYDDPWGVADWWLSANPWLHGSPVDLLGEPGQDRLMAAAFAAVGR